MVSAGYPRLGAILRPPPPRTSGPSSCFPTMALLITRSRWSIAHSATTNGMGSRSAGTSRTECRSPRWTIRCGAQSPDSIWARSLTFVAERNSQAPARSTRPFRNSRKPCASTPGPCRRTSTSSRSMAAWVSTIRRPSTTGLRSISIAIRPIFTTTTACSCSSSIDPRRQKRRFAPPSRSIPTTPTRTTISVCCPSS